VATLLAAAVVEYVPDVHRLQTDTPDSDAKEPARQFRHKLAPLELMYVPESHILQLYGAPDPEEYVPASQGTHTDTPEDEYVPLSHGRQAD